MKKLDTGIVLRKINYSDSSLILTLFTKTNGIQKFIYQGGKKKAGALYPLSRIEFNYYQRPDSELWKLTSAETRGTSEIPFHPLRSVIAFFIADVIYQSIKDQQTDLSTYDFLERSIEELNTTNDFANFNQLFLCSFSEHLGINPTVSVNSPVYFLPLEGEFTSSLQAGTMNESGEHVQYLVELFQKGKIGIYPKQVRLAALELLLKYYQLHIPGFNIQRSFDILREVLL